MALSVAFVQRDAAVDVKEIDKTIKNKWNWSWCDKVLFPGSPDQHLVGDCFRKLNQAGDAFCTCCQATIRYGSSGWTSLQKHATKSEHKRRLRERRTNYMYRLSVVEHGKEQGTRKETINIKKFVFFFFFCYFFPTLFKMFITNSVNCLKLQSVVNQY